MNQNKLFLPISIIIAGLVVAGAIIFTNRDEAPKQVANTDEETSELAIRPIGEKDHILGNPDAEIVIVEYSDFECPYCASFHPTMERIMSEYGSQGKVAWVYRHFPLRSIHPNAQGAAEASECVANLGDNEKFWSFSKKVFESRNAILPLLQKGAATRTEADNAEIAATLSTETLTGHAVELGIDEAAFKSCVAAKTYANEVNEDYEDGALVAQSDPKFGTPYSIVLSKDGIETTIAGAQPYALVKQIVDTVLAK